MKRGASNAGSKQGSIPHSHVNVPPAPPVGPAPPLPASGAPVAAPYANYGYGPVAPVHAAPAYTHSNSKTGQHGQWQVQWQQPQFRPPRPPQPQLAQQGGPGGPVPRPPSYPMQPAPPHAYPPHQYQPQLNFGPYPPQSGLARPTGPQYDYGAPSVPYDAYSSSHQSIAGPQAGPPSKKTRYDQSASNPGAAIQVQSGYMQPYGVQNSMHMQQPQTSAFGNVRGAGRIRNTARRADGARRPRFQLRTSQSQGHASPNQHRDHVSNGPYQPETLGPKGGHHRGTMQAPSVNGMSPQKGQSSREQLSNGSARRDASAGVAANRTTSGNKTGFSSQNMIPVAGSRGVMNQREKGAGSQLSKSSSPAHSVSTIAGAEAPARNDSRFRSPFSLYDSFDKPQCAHHDFHINSIEIKELTWSWKVPKLQAAKDVEPEKTSTPPTPSILDASEGTDPRDQDKNEGDTEMDDSEAASKISEKPGADQSSEPVTTAFDVDDQSVLSDTANLSVAGESKEQSGVVSNGPSSLDTSVINELRATTQLRISFEALETTGSNSPDTRRTLTGYLRQKNREELQGSSVDDDKANDSTPVSTEQEPDESRKIQAPEDSTTGAEVDTTATTQQDSSDAKHIAQEDTAAIDAETHSDDMKVDGDTGVKSEENAVQENGNETAATQVDAASAAEQPDNQAASKALSKVDPTQDLLSNYVMITHARSRVWLYIDADVINSFTVSRSEHKIEIVVRVDPPSPGSCCICKGVLLQTAASDKSSLDGMTAAQAKAIWDSQPNSDAENETLGFAPNDVPPFFKLDPECTEVTIVVHLDPEWDSTEPEWLKKGKVNELFSLLQQKIPKENVLEPVWSDKIHITDPDPPLTLEKILENWITISTVGQKSGRQVFVDDMLALRSNAGNGTTAEATETEVERDLRIARCCMEIAAHLVRGERAVTSAETTPTLHRGMVSNLRRDPHQIESMSWGGAVMLSALNFSLQQCASLLDPSLDSSRETAQALRTEISKLLTEVPANMISKAIDLTWKETLSRSGSSDNGSLSEHARPNQGQQQVSQNRGQRHRGNSRSNSKRKR